MDSTSKKPIRIAFDMGGVITKYPEVFKPLLAVLNQIPELVEAWIISDIRPEQKVCDLLELNGVRFNNSRVRSADHVQYGESCKAVLCQELGIDILIDDHIGYIADDDHVRLLVMPNTRKPYFADSWKTDGTEGEWGRKVHPQKGDHPNYGKKVAE